MDVFFFEASKILVDWLVSWRMKEEEEEEEFEGAQHYLGSRSKKVRIIFLVTRFFLLKIFSYFLSYCHKFLLMLFVYDDDGGRTSFLFLSTFVSNKLLPVTFGREPIRPR
jgi:hypothetical protein